MSRVASQRRDPTFFAMIPKMAMLDLTPFELALYCNYKQTAADDPEGYCSKSNGTLSRETSMSVSAVKKAREGLFEKGFITVEIHEDENGVINTPSTVRIVDVWETNYDRFKGGSEKSRGGRQKTTPLDAEKLGAGSGNPGPVSTEPQRITNQEKLKEEKPIKNNHHQEAPAPEEPAAIPALPNDDDDDRINSDQVFDFSVLKPYERQHGPLPEWCREQIIQETMRVGAFKAGKLVTNALEKDKHNPWAYLTTILKNEPTEEPEAHHPGSGDPSSQKESLLPSSWTTGGALDQRISEQIEQMRSEGVELPAWLMNDGPAEQMVRIVEDEFGADEAEEVELM